MHVQGNVGVEHMTFEEGVRGWAIGFILFMQEEFFPLDVYSMHIFFSA